MWIPSGVVHTLRSLTSVLFIASLCGLAACAGTADETPVASVAVTPTRTRVPVGSPLELTYRFEPAAAVDGDYTVFVHLLNADGQMLWADDHQPPVPTSQWVVGTPVEYTRMQFLPPAVHPGDVTVEVGVYRGSDRLPLASAVPPQNPTGRAYPVAKLQIAPASENVFVIYQSGWYPEEFPPDNPSQPWKWTQKVATVAFRHPKSDATVLLEYSGQPDLFPGNPQQITVVGANNAAIATFPADSFVPTLRRIPVTSAQLGTADLAELRIEVDRTFVPAETPTAGPDTRALGVRVYHLLIEPR
jgi:hypothetical protein